MRIVTSLSEKTRRSEIFQIRFYSPSGNRAHSQPLPAQTSLSLLMICFSADGVECLHIAPATRIFLESFRRQLKRLAARQEQKHNHKNDVFKNWTMIDRLFQFKRKLSTIILIRILVERKKNVKLSWLIKYHPAICQPLKFCRAPAIRPAKINTMPAEMIIFANPIISSS